MKKIARNKLNAKSQKIQGPVFLKILLIFKIDFFIIIHTLTPKSGQRKSLRNRYTFISISLHFLMPSVVPFIQNLELKVLVICSFELKLRFLSNPPGPGDFISFTVHSNQSICKSDLCRKTLAICSKSSYNEQKSKIDTLRVNEPQPWKEEHYAYNSNTGYR